jgi:MFS superfamily sulfate permease-like transporter
MAQLPRQNLKSAAIGHGLPVRRAYHCLVALQACTSRKNSAFSNLQSSDILAVVPITILYVILGISTAALVAVGVAVVIRIRRLSRASKTQFQRALEEESGEHAVLARPEDSQVTS